MMRISLGRLRTRLILLVLLAVIPALGLALYSGMKQRDKALSRAQVDALRMAENASDVQERLIENTRQIFFALSQMPEIQNLNPAACSKILKNIQSQSKGYTMFFALKPNGDLFATALPVSGHMTFTDRAWYQQVLKTREFVISEYMIGRISGKAAVTLAYPVLDRKGQLKAILGTGLDLGWINQFMAESKPPAGTALTVIDRKGTILLRYPDPEKFIGRTMPEGSILKAILAKEEGVSEAIDLDGIPRLYGFTSLDRFARSVYVSVGIPKEIAFGEATRDMRRNLIWLGIVGALAIIAAWLGSSLFIMRPVDRLLGATKRLAEGDLTVRTGPRYNRGEIGQLGFAFDQMANALAEKEAQIREYTGELERKVRERTRAFQESEERFRIAAQSANDLIWEWDIVKGELAWFGKIDEMLGYEPGEFSRTIEAWEKIIHPNDHDRVMTTLDQHLETRKPYLEEYRVLKKDGSVLYWLDSGIGLWDEEGKAYKMIGAVSDITDRRKAEDRIRKLNHVYAMLSDINQAIVRIREPQALFKEACRVAVEKGDFPLAWIGLVDDSTKQFRVVASAGKSGGYLEKINISLEGAPLGYCPIDNALREGEQVICNVIEQNEDLAPCQKIAIGLGFRSSASFPLRISGRIRGTFNFYAGEADFFDEEERKLLDELATDISFATEFAEKETERRRVEEAFVRSEERFRLAAESSTDLIYEWDIKERVDWFGKIDELLGYAPGEFPRTLGGWADSVHPDDRDQVMAAVKDHLEKNEPYDVEYRITKKDGTYHYWWARGTAVRDAEGNPYRWVGAISDITDRKCAEEEIKSLAKFPSENPNPVLRVGRDGTLLYANEASYMLLHDWQLEIDRPAPLVLREAVSETLTQQAGKTIDMEHGQWIISFFVTPIVNAGYANFYGRDVTDRRRAEEALRESEETARALVNATTDSIFLIDTHGTVLALNEMTAKRLGKRVDEILGYYLYDFLPLDVAQRRKKRLDEVFHTGKPAYFEDERQGVWFDTCGYPILDAKGKVARLAIYGRDITERKRAEETVRSSESFLNSVIEQTPYATWISDDKGILIRLNQACRDLLHITDKEVVGKYNVLQDTIVEEQGYMPLVRSVFERGATVRFTLHYDSARLQTLTLRHTASVVLDVTIFPIKDSQGKVVNAVIQHIDITHRKRAEEMIESLAKFPSENPNPVLRVGRDGTLLYANEASSMLLQDWQLEIGKPAPLFLREAASETLTQQIGKIIDTEHVQRELSFFVAPIGKVGYANFYGWDVTDRRRAEKEIRRLNQELEERVIERTAQLQASNKELEAFAYSVSHDLRAPLRAIDGFSRILLEDYLDKLDDEGERVLNVIRGSTKKMGQLIDDLLVFSRLGRQEINLSQINMDKLAKSVCDELRAAVAEETLQLDIKTLPSAFGDRSMIRQVFVNLLANAIKFTKPREKAIIEVGGGSEQAENTYYVRDNGVGFDMQYVNKLFGVFQRLHSTEEFEGTGVGLAIVQRIIQRHGGRVWAEGKVNEGATFWFTLPK